MPNSETIWTKSDNLFFTMGVRPEKIFTAYSLWKLATSSGSSAARAAYGDLEDNVSIRDIAYSDEIAVEVASGLQTKIDVVDHAGQVVTLCETADDAISYKEWDLKCVERRSIRLGRNQELRGYGPT
jgi:hypothetical protein